MRCASPAPAAVIAGWCSSRLQLSAHFIMELLMRPGPTPLAQGLQTHLWRRLPSSPGLHQQHHPVLGVWWGKEEDEGRTVGRVHVKGKWWWWLLLRGERGGPLCPEAVWKGHGPGGAPTGRCCGVSGGRLVFVQTGSGRLRGACLSEYVRLHAKGKASVFLWQSLFPATLEPSSAVSFYRS